MVQIVKKVVAKYLSAKNQMYSFHTNIHNWRVSPGVILW